MTRPDEFTDLDVQVYRETPTAILISLDGERDGAVWLALSAIELAYRRGSETRATITLTERLAIEKGLV